jgi:hypothetical protein
MKTIVFIFFLLITSTVFNFFNYTQKTYYAFGATPEASDPPLKTIAETYNISGTVTGNIYQNPIPNAKILIYTPDNPTTPLDSVFTDENGYYNKNLTFTTTVPTNPEQTLENKIYPNPYTNSTNINVNTQNEGTYTLTITNTNGQTLSTQQLNLDKGQNQINLTGGNKGLNIITLQNENEQHTYKAIQTANTGATHKATKTQSNNPDYKSTNTPDSLRLRILAPQYYTADTNIKLVPVAIAEIEMIQEPYEFNTTIKPYLETGHSPLTINPTFSITIDWPQQGIIPATTQTYPLINEEININKYMYPHNGTLGTAQIYNDTTDNDMDGFWAQNWSLGRLPQQKSNRPNIYQNEEFALIPEQKTTMPLDSLQGRTIHHYVIKNKAETQPGVYENLDSEFTRGLMGSTGNWVSTGMFIDLKPFAVADSIDIVLKEYNETTNIPMEQWQLDRVTTTLNAILATKYLPNGDTLLPPHRFYSITNTSDPKWQALIARGFENSVRLAFHNGTPGNGRTWELNYTYNGHLRLKYTYAKFNIDNSNGILLAEIISAIAGVEEGTGGLTTYVSNPDMLPTEYCKSISAMPVLFNLGSGQSWKNTANKPKLTRYETLETITTHNPDGTTTQTQEIISKLNQ